MANLLARLDHDWTVYIQPRIGHDVPDFVAIHDRYGVVAVEVKDWRPNGYRQSSNGVVEYRTGTGAWERSEEQPRYQAYRYRTAIYDQFFAMPDDGAQPTHVVRAVVVFPQMATSEARKLLTHVGVDKREQSIPVWGGDGLRQSLSKVIHGHACEQPRPESIRRLKRQMAESSITIELREPARLSPDARNIESNPENARIRRVRCPAGCGKSFGLAARAARLAADGNRVLVLSFNYTLANYLRTLVTARCREYAANPSLVTCTHIHSFCGRLVDDARQAGFPTETPSDGPSYDRIIRQAIAAC